MSRSIRRYKGLSHTQSGMHHQKKAKRDSSRILRARLSADFESFAPLGRKCHKSNCYDGAWITDSENAKLIASTKSIGYDWRRVVHKLTSK